MLALLIPRRLKLVTLLKTVRNHFDTDTVDRTLRVIVSVLGYTREGMVSSDYELVADEVLAIVTSPSSDNLHEGVGLLQELARVEASRTVVHQKGLVDLPLLDSMLTKASQRTMSRLFTFLQLCSTSTDIVDHLTSPTLLNSMLNSLHCATVQDGLLCIMGFLYELAHRHDVASLLREESSARKIFSALDRGSPSVCRRTIELISVLGRREPSFWRLLVDSIDDRPSALDSLCHLAIEGPRSVKSHAAWLISSLANYDESEAAHTLALVGALVRLLNANHGDPTVLEHALWGLTQICLDSDEVVDGLLTMGVPSIVCNLQSDRDWYALGRMPLWNCSRVLSGLAFKGNACEPWLILRPARG